MKRNIIMVLLFTLVLGGALLAKEKMILKVKVQTANVRSEPDASAPIIAKVASGTLLEAAGKKGAWYEVSVNDKDGEEVAGYIHNTVVEVIGADEEEAEVKPRSAVRRNAPRARARKEFAKGGIKLMGGLSMANMKVSGEIPPEVNKKSKMGFIGGLGFESGGMIGFEADLLFTPGGTVLTATQEGQTAKISLSGYGIAVPLLLKVRFMPGTTPYILAGGEIGYILSQKVIIESEGQTEERDVKDEINRLYYGLVFGGGFELQTGGMNLLFEARYNMGLSNQIKDPAADEYAKATALSITVGVRF